MSDARSTPYVAGVVATTVGFSSAFTVVLAGLHGVGADEHQAASGLMNLVMMPMWIVSGVFFSAQRFPDALQPVIKALPLTAAIDALRANMLQGAGLAQVSPELAVLGAWMLVCFPLALWLFRWR